jgi:prepilin-type N-terminal cleavage/methylation domain-containing protein
MAAGHTNKSVHVSGRAPSLAISHTRKWQGRSVLRTRGFTLLELLIALSILAMLTMVAVQSLGPVEQQARQQATLRTLENIKAAILHVNQTGGTTVIGGFAADMGCLPDLTTTITLLNDLAFNNSNLGTSRTLFGAIPGQPYGWRGPYLQTSLTATDLRDGWGQPLTFGLVDFAGNPVTTLSNPSDRIVIAGPGSPVDATGPIATSITYGSLTALPLTVRVYGLDSSNNRSDITGTVSLSLKGGISPTDPSSVGHMDLSTAISGTDTAFQFYPLPSQLLVGSRVLTVTFTSASMTGYTITSPQTFHLNLLPGTSPAQDVIVCRQN